jgi:acetyl-CoA acetyltransferase
MSEEKAKELGLNPKVYVKDFLYTAIDPKEDLLIGNAYSIPKILKKNNLTIHDIDIFEMHEAFASQVLATQKLLDSEKFCNNELNQNKVGPIPENKLNIYGGSIAIGHPFSATALRMINTISNEMERKNYKYGLVSVCAAGAMSGSLLLERNV